MTVNYRWKPGWKTHPGAGLLTCLEKEDWELNFRVEVKKSIEARLELLLDLLLAAFEHVHRDVRLVAIVQFQGCVAHLGNFI